MVLAVCLMITVCCLATTSVNEQSSDDQKSVSKTLNNKNENDELSEKRYLENLAFFMIVYFFFVLLNREGKYLNYLRLPDGECYNCSSYKCTNHTANMGGSEWCIMLFSDAVAHCDSDPNCGGYTMTNSEWFHKKYDKNGQVAVHLCTAGEKPIACPTNEQWSSYEKQSAHRQTPITYGRSTCETRSVKYINEFQMI